MKTTTFLITTTILLVIGTNKRLYAQQANPFYSQLETNELPKANVNIDSLLQGAKEIESKRTPFNSYYITKNGRIVEKNSATPINYPDANGKLQPIKIELTPNNNGWIANQQPYPCRVEKDGSTGICLGNGKELAYSIDSRINGEWFSGQVASVNKNQVVFNMGSNVQKKVSFKTNSIETDYIINAPTGKGITISEEVKIPANSTLAPEASKGKYVQGKWQGNYVLKSSDGTALARFTIPLCYDATGKTCLGTYQLVTENGKHILKTSVPDEWLKTATYPVTVDPLVIGLLSFWASGSMPVCFLPNYSNNDSMQVTIPGGITVTELYISTSIQSNFNISPLVYTNHVYVKFVTSCGASPVLHNPSSGAVYTDLFLGSYDFHNPLTCCYAPSCSDQSFWLKQENARDSAGSGCDTDYLYYSGNPVQFDAYIEGETDTALHYTITPNKVCSNNCQINMKVQAEYGVPPYTLTHPWLGKKDTVFGKYSSCTSFDYPTIPLTIPGCPTYCGKTDTLFVPAPIIVDACGDTAVNGFKAQQLIINPTPELTVSPKTQAVCSGSPINFTISPCIAGTTVNWTGTNGSSGSGTTVSALLTDTTSKPDTVIYTATPSLNGCIGDTVKMTAISNPLPVVTVSPYKLDTVDLGSSQQLTATGGTTYLWSPDEGLSCNNCANPIATPTVTTTYYVNVTNSEGCSETDSVKLVVIDANVSIPNVFTPGTSDQNSIFYIKGLNYHPNSQLKVFNRWGNMVYQNDNYTNNWNGGNESDGVYFYILALENGKKYDGYVQIIR